MKRITIAIVAVVALAGLSFAQPYGGPGPMGGGMYGYQPGAVQAAPQAKTIEGKLVFVDKIPAIQTKDATYLLRLPLFFQSAYFDGIKEGATIKADGYELPKVAGQDKAWFHATKAVINGKTYDYTNFAGRGMGGAFGGRHRGGGFGGYGGNYGPPMMGGRGGRW